MGNYGRFDYLVDRYDPYGTGELIQKRFQQRAYNQGAWDQRHAGPTETQKNEAIRDALRQERLAGDLAEDKEMRARGENDYERSLDKRGLLSTKIEGEIDGDDGQMHPATFRVQGKLTPADVALYREAANQGLLSGDSVYANRAEDRAAMARLLETKRNDSLQQQARADALDKEARDREAAAQARTDALEKAKLPADLQSAQFKHDEEMLRAKLAANAEDPDKRAARRLTEIQAQAAEEEMARRRTEHRSPLDESILAQAQTFAPRAMAGDPEAYHALRLLTDGRPGLGIRADVYKPSVEKVLAQPQIKGELEALASAVKSAGYSPSPEAIALVKRHADRAVQAAGDFGPEVQAEVASIVKQHIQTAGATGTAVTRAVPFIGPLLGGYRTSHANDARTAFADLIGEGE